MITPLLVIFLIVIGWSAAALALLWGMLRVARHHHTPSPGTQPYHHQPSATQSHTAHASLSA